MGSAVGQVPELRLPDHRRGSRRSRKTPVIVKLTPNVTDVVYPARAAQEGRRRRGLAHQHDQLASSASISTRFTPRPDVGGRSAHGGYCGPAVKPIALNMVSSVAKDAEVRLPISGIGGISNWRDAAEFMLLGCDHACRCAPRSCTTASASSRT